MHCSGQRHLFNTYTPYPRGTKFLDGMGYSPIEALGFGNIRLRFPGPSGEIKEIPIHAIYAATEFNFLSLARLGLGIVSMKRGSWRLMGEGGIFAICSNRTGLPAIRTYGRGKNGQDLKMSREDIKAATL